MQAGRCFSTVRGWQEVHPPAESVSAIIVSTQFNRGVAELSWVLEDRSTATTGRLSSV